jgi:DNA-binding Lrp family transcriptional regulator
VADTGALASLSPKERALVSAVKRHPRAPIADLARIVGLSERTVTRYLERLRSTGVLRFAATLLYERLSDHLVAQLEIACVPHMVTGVAEQLSARPDMRFVGVTAGSQDVVAEIVVRGRSLLVDGGAPVELHHEGA